jgi:inner membrane protein
MNSTKPTVSFIDLIRNPIISRIFMMGFLILALLIPASMISSLIDEREGRRNQVIREINSRWALGQTIAGPMLEIPYKIFHETKQFENGKEKKTLTSEIRTAYFLPDRLEVTGEIYPETRCRGIYKSIVYTAGLQIKGEFLFPDFERWKIPNENIIWDDATFSFGITDMRGINKNIEVQWNDSHLTPKPGIKDEAIFSRGISTNVTMNKDKKEKNRFSMKLDIRGSKTIDVLPLGRKTNIQLSSTWTTPSFNGAFLPKKRVINDKGFRAEWEVFDFNREFPQQWKEYKNWNIPQSKFGLALYVPVDEYQKTTRSIKYAILFIALTFLAFFLFIEMLNKKRIHPIQYLLVGFALCIFYLLLLSLSEHLGFDMAYLISSLSIVGLTTVYTRSICQTLSLTALMASIFTGLYGFLYVILRLEDYSLLMGSVGLFGILAAVMIITRKIDWYPAIPGPECSEPR